MLGGSKGNQSSLRSGSSGGSMRCPGCGSENLAGKKFCGDCGTLLAVVCAGCGAENPSGKRFCGDCGASLTAATGNPGATVTQPGTPAREREESSLSLQHDIAAAERRHLSVLFCDVVGSTEIASHLDPEEWREIAARYQRSAAEAVRRLGGHVAKFLG